MATYSWADMEVDLAEAAQALSAMVPGIQAHHVEQALLTSLGLSSRDELISTPWTPDIIVHHVMDFDFESII